MRKKNHAGVAGKKYLSTCSKDQPARGKSGKKAAKEDARPTRHLVIWHSGLTLLNQEKTSVGTRSQTHI